ncbi:MULTISPECIES: hypothetical protein [Kamptonema]|uniref:hypothetical protein n=1 Tax=Kamptonema TaxID=1501433 RepID=UPI0011D27014|nr:MULTISPECIES: hypothetical protein [Kamptonema]
MEYLYVDSWVAVSLAHQSPKLTADILYRDFLDNMFALRSIALPVLGKAFPKLTTKIDDIGVIKSRKRNSRFLIFLKIQCQFITIAVSSL